MFYPLPEKYKYSVAFESRVIPLTNEKATQYLSLASKDNIKQYLPKNVDFNEKIDCLAIAGQSFLANKLNLNDDGVSSETAIQIAKLFPFSYIDANHKRSDIVGVILSASYSDEETNTELTEEEVKTYTKPFSVTIGGLIWKLANKEITDLLEDENKKDSLYFSWEIGFSDAQLIEIPKDKFNFSEGKIVNNIEQIKEYDKLLKANGGIGQLKNGNKIGRIIVGDVLPLGVGIVTNPAGQLTPLTIGQEEIKDIKVIEKSKSSETITCPECGHKIEMEDDEEDNMEDNIEDSEDSEAKKSCKNENKISQSNINSVTNSSKENIIIKKHMDKISKITDLNDENLKECKASAVIELFNESLKEADKKWKEQEELTKNAQAEKLKVEANLTKIQEDLKKLQDIQAAKEAEEIYTQRMTYFDDTYELSKEERQAIAAEIKDADKDSFEKAKSKFDIFLKDKSKAAIKEKQDLEEAEAKKSGKVFDKEKKKWVNKDEMKEEKKESKASLDENGKVIDEALANGKNANAALPNAQSGEQTLEAKYAEAFKPENCIEISKR